MGMKSIAPLLVAVLANVLVVYHPSMPAQGSGKELRFEEIGTSAGIRFLMTSGTASKLFLVESMGGGVAFIDYDNDGWQDLYFVDGSTIEDEQHHRRRGANRLYRNRGDGTFIDVTQRAGVAGRGWGMGACVGDVNGDGFDDMYVTTLGSDILFINNGNGTFRDASRAAGISDTDWGSSCAFGDYDGDGDLDLFVSNYMRFDVTRPQALTNQGTPCEYRGLPVACGPRGMTPVRNRFYENVGGGRFVDVSDKTGIGSAKPSFSLGVVWGDYDNDGDQDIFVANDSMPNFLFRNNGNKTFSEVALEAGVAFSPEGRIQDGMGADFGDYDNDGDLDLIYTAFSDDYNPLFTNGGHGAFVDGSLISGLIAPSLPFVGWGVVFADLDLDGFLDLAVVNGHLYPQLDHDSRSQTGSIGYRQRNLLFRNLGDRRFREIGEHAGAGFQNARFSSRGLAAGDINNDGLVDLVITHLDSAPSVLINRTKPRPSNWLLVKVKGVRSNRSGIGARVSVRTGRRVQMREVKSGASFQSQSDLRVHFGLAESSNIDELIVRWTDGRIDRRFNVAANQILTIEEAVR
jgi:hypothetical protein